MIAFVSTSLAHLVSHRQVKSGTEEKEVVSVKDAGRPNTLWVALFSTIGAIGASVAAAAVPT